MKAWVVGRPASLDTFAIVERPAPEVSAGRIAIRWHATSLNFHDFLVIIGVLPTVDGRIPMSDGAGEVIAVGEGVSQWKVGDRVMSLFFPQWRQGVATVESNLQMTGDTIDGCGCEISVVDADTVTAMPKGYSYAEAATLPCAAATAWRAIVEECRVKPGDSVLVEGTGGMALSCLQFAKAAGATVYATSSSDEKLVRLKQLGADVTLNYRSDPQWGETIARLTGGGVDYVVDSGGAASLEQSIIAARTGGTVMLVGVLGGIDVQFSLKYVFAKQQTLKAIAVGSRQCQLDMIKGIEANGIKPVIDSIRPFEGLADAFRYQATGAHFGKIVVQRIEG